VSRVERQSSLQDDGAEHLDQVALPGDKTRLRNYAVISLLNYMRKVLGA
jgi:hypothetical protein|tara:strand:- start:46 stop:192 length:147 start_codon:yes stop_codon:yes gene_type:complete